MLRNAEVANGISGNIKSVDLKQLKGEKKMKIKRGFILAAAVSVLVLGCMALTSCGSDTAGKGGNITVISREDGSGTRGAFIELFGIEEITNGEKMDMTVDTADITNSTSVMMTSVSGNVRAIGYISLGSLNDSVKALNVDGAEATAENIKNGTYKVSRPFNIVTKDNV